MRSRSCASSLSAISCWMAWPSVHRNATLKRSRKSFMTTKTAPNWSAACHAGEKPSSVNSGTPWSSGAASATSTLQPAVR